MSIFLFLGRFPTLPDISLLDSSLPTSYPGPDRSKLSLASKVIGGTQEITAADSCETVL